MAKRDDRAATPAAPARPGPVIPDALYTLPEAAPHLRMGESTLRRHLRTGEIPRSLFTRIGGRLYMTGAQITAVIEAGQLPATPAGPAHRRRRTAAA